MISDAMMVSKGIALLAHTAMLNEDIRDWRRQTTNHKTWAYFIIFIDPIARKVKR